MTSKGASAVLGPVVTMNPGASMTTFTVLPLPPPTAGAAYWPPAEQHLPPLVTPSSPLGQPVVLPALRGTPLMAGDAGHGPTGSGAGNIIAQVRSEVGRAEPPKTQTLVLTQAPLTRRAPGPLCGGAACPVPQSLAASAAPTTMLALDVGGIQAVEGGWSPGLPPQAPPQAAQLARIIPPVKAGPWPNGASRDGGLATSQSIASSFDSCDPSNVYENFRRWQRFKAVARSHLPQGPDAEALSCFFVPVLRSLSRRKPTMTLEDGLKRAMREWQKTSSFDRMIFYEMAQKFMEFEEKEMEIQKSQCMEGAQGLPFQAPPRTDPGEPPAPTVGLQPVHIARKAIPREQPAFLQPQNPQLPQETKVPEQIRPEPVREYVDIMDGLQGLARSATGEAAEEGEKDRKQPLQEDDGTCLGPGLQSYIDELFSQEDFVTKVEEVIDSKFLKQMDPLSLVEELEQEVALTPAKLVVKEEERVQAPPSHGALPSDCHSSESEALEDISSGLGPREASIPKVTSSAQETRRPGGCNSEEEDTLPSLSFFLGSPNKLLPWQFPQSPPVPASGLVFPGGQGRWGAPRFLSHERQGRSRIEPLAAKSRKRALGGGPAPAVKIPRLDTGLGVSVRPAWALGPAWSSQPQKIMCASFDTGKRRRLHCSQ